jgi:hypothetical protein
MFPLYRSSYGCQAPCPETNGREAAAVVCGLDAAAYELRMQRRPLHAGPPPTRFIGSIAKGDLTNLHEWIRPELAGRGAWIVDATTLSEPGAYLPLPLPLPDTSQPSDRLYIINACRDTPKVIRPPAKPLRLAHAFSGVIRGMAARLPACLRDHALPGDRLPLHLLCLASMLQQGEFPPTGPGLLHREHGLSLFMSLEIAARHLHWLRLAYPADERGLFMAADRAIFFHLDQTPRPLAEIQSVFRDVRREEVVRSLQRAVAAGLAWEPRPGCFAVSPPPPPPSRAEIMSSIVAAGTDGY